MEEERDMYDNDSLHAHFHPFYLYYFSVNITYANLLELP